MDITFKGFVVSSFILGHCGSENKTNSQVRESVYSEEIKMGQSCVKLISQELIIGK